MTQKTPIKALNSNDEGLELALRPTAWEDYVGQEKIKANLKLIMQAAKGRSESCDHLLFCGQAGLGKTTLAYLIGKEMGVNVRATSGPALEKAGDIAAILSNLEPNEVLFIDEAHRINKMVEEVMYPALESRRLHLIIGKGPSARTLTLELPPFTLIAATTRTNLISSPLRSRFGAVLRLDYYRLEDIEKIIRRSAEILKTGISAGAIMKLARASRFTPRVANRLLKRARDYAQVYKKEAIDEEVVRDTLDLLEIDEMGLEQTDRDLLTVIIKRFNGGPVGIKAIAAALNDEPDAVEEVYEPFLMSLGFLERTQLGRIATDSAYKHLGLKLKNTLI